MANLDLDKTDKIFASPIPGDAKQNETQTVTHAASQKMNDKNLSDLRLMRLQDELGRVREVNRAIEGVVESLNATKTSIDTVQQTVQNASALLGTWTKILSQTEHNQQLILDPMWQGATNDMEETESQEAKQRQDRVQKAAEEQFEREEAQRRNEEEERRKLTSTPTSKRSGSRIRGATGVGRYLNESGRGGRGRDVAASRASSAFGRGMAGTRGRGRGIG